MTASEVLISPVLVSKSSLNCIAAHGETVDIWHGLSFSSGNSNLLLSTYDKELAKHTWCACVLSYDAFLEDRDVVSTTALDLSWRHVFFKCTHSGVLRRCQALG